MAKLNVVDVEGKVVRDIELTDSIFGIEPNEFAVQAVVKNYLANQRQGTQSAKTRAEVRGGGRKPFRQKGTGRHRQGSSTDPSQIGGGIVFAPKPRDYRYSLNKKLKRLALKSALSAKVADNELIVVDEFKFTEPKTKEMVKVLANIKADKKALIVMDEKDENVVRSAHNIPGVRTALVSTMNVYEIVNHYTLVLTEALYSRAHRGSSQEDRGGIRIMKTGYDVIISPIITENTMDMAADKKYAFKVAKDSNKTEIRKALEEIFGVDVAKVNIVNVSGKKKRLGRTFGTTSSYKKAVVTLTPDSKEIELFQDM